MVCSAPWWSTSTRSNNNSSRLQICRIQAQADMEFLGIGAPELFFILIIALILLGPKDMQKAGKTIGRWLNQLVRSDWWRAFRQTSEEIRRLPTNLMREANREMMDVERDLREKVEPA